MFTLHNKELLEVKKLKPVRMIDILKSKQQGSLEKAIHQFVIITKRSLKITYYFSPAFC